MWRAVGVLAICAMACRISPGPPTPPPAPVVMDPNRILCPVLAQLNQDGILIPDATGNVEEKQIEDALMDKKHGFSTGVRGGATNVPDYGTCNGQYPCEERFQRFYVPCADSQGRFNYSSILCIICNAKRMGDRGGEFSYNPGAALPWPG
eukprot:gene33427-59321_t